MSLSPPSITATVATLGGPSFNLTKLITQTTDALVFDHPTAHYSTVLPRSISLLLSRLSKSA